MPVTFREQLYFIALVYPVKIIMNKFVRKTTTIYEYYCKKKLLELIASNLIILLEISFISTAL